MSYIYLASPYADEDAAVRQARYRAVSIHVTYLLVEQKRAVFSPIVHCHDLPTGTADWRWYNERMLEAALQLDILMLDGWEDSKGIEAEIAMAELRFIPVYKVEPRNAIGTLVQPALDASSVQ